MYLKQLLISSIVLVFSFLILIPSTVLAAEFDPAGTFIIKTTFYGYPATNPKEDSEWPRVILYANNGKNFDGPIDYSDCSVNRNDDPSGYSCGNPNLFREKFLAVIDVKGRQYSESVTVKKSQLLGKAQGGTEALEYTKLSYAFINDYWNPGANQDRDVSIVKIEIIDPQQNNKVVKSITPSPTLLRQIRERTDLSVGVYADWGLINFEGIRNEQQDGMNHAFDGKEREYVPWELDSMPSFWINQNTGWEWKLTKEGSLNIVIKDLAATLPPPKQYSCKIALQPVTCAGSEATFKYTFTQQPNFDAKDFNIRLNAYPGNFNECKNENGEGIDWFCGLTEGRGLDQFFTLNTKTLSKTAIVKPGVEYSVNVSVDFADGKRIPREACTSEVVKFTCPQVSTLPGDLNNDRVITVADYGLLIANFGWNGTPGAIPADITKDGKVDILDYNKVIENFGKRQ